MKHKFLSVLGALVLVCCLAIGPVQGAGPPSKPLLITDMDVTLEPGVGHGWVMRYSSACGGYLVEVTPLESSVEGAYVEEALVQPEYNGGADEWWDVLRVRIPADQPTLNANVRVYQTCPLPVVLDVEADLQPGVWMGWPVGPASVESGYVVEVTPLESSTYEGASVGSAIQQEYDGSQWIDALRVMVAPYFPSVKANLRVYSTADMPVFAEYETELQPGVWASLPLQRSAAKGAYVVEVNPLETMEEGAWVEQVVVRPEFDGKHWNDVARVLMPAGDSSLAVQVRVYKAGR